MQITLKKIKVHNDMSEETTCFSAEVYADGKLIGYAKNNGHGGSTDIDSLRRDELRKAEEWARTLPPIKSGTFSLDVTLDFYIDMLLGVYEAAKNRTNKKNGFIMWYDVQDQPHTPVSEYPEFNLWLKDKQGVYQPHRAIA